MKKNRCVIIAGASLLFFFAFVGIDHLVTPFLQLKLAAQFI
jgi:hypothetical protein